MPEQRLFHAPNINMPHLGQALADWYRAQKFDVQMLEAPGGGFVIQARQEEAWRSVLGMSATLNVLLRHQQDGNLIVEIGAGKWIDKAAAAGVGMFILWPMLLTAGFGAWQQSQLPQRTFEFIQNFLATGGSMSADMALMHASQLEQARRVVSMGNVGPAPGVASPPAYGYGGGAPQPMAAAPVGPVPMPTGPTPPSDGPVDGVPEVGGAVRFCMECGAKLPDTARFCPGCGSKVG